ncbi:hypothetical protein K7X08_033355 [Anisodus acutangulus]|uniref:LysM domain-containing protein n=1 Tax=Anisodus acutangulus TaxID=402998 RepID=A0A9Q1RCH4_9SOLA|nr:hypothetical protein K7X08_033355 [Anisodus acutangulus]
MAKANDRVANMFLFLTFMILSCLLFITLAESNQVTNAVNRRRALTCLKVVNVKNGDTCFNVSKTFGLGSDVFNAINPNLNCTALFVGQWLCVDGTLS